MVFDIEIQNNKLKKLMDGNQEKKKIVNWDREFLVWQEAHTELKTEVLSFQVFEDTRKHDNLELESI